MKKVKESIIAYIAGYIDGDGCFFIGKVKPPKRLTHKYRAVISISSTNKEVLCFIKKKFGGIVSLAKGEHDNMKNLFNYSSSSSTVSKYIAESVFQYLTEKKEHCAIFLQFLNCSSKEDKDVLIDKIRILKKEGDLINREHITILNSIKNTVAPSKIDYAYLAGFIDAECCLSIGKWKPDGYTNFTYKISLQCNNARYPVFKWIIERFGGNISYYDRSRQVKAKKDQLIWRVSGKALYSILPKIKDFLMYKRPVCEELIKFYETTLKNGGARHTEDFRRHYAQVIRIREEIIHKIHQLNRKGLK